MLLSACSNTPELKTVTIPEYIEVPGPREVWYPPERLLQSCIEPGETLDSSGLIWVGMTWGDMSAAVTELWDGRLTQCDDQINQLRQLVEQAQQNEQQGESE